MKKPILISIAVLSLFASFYSGWFAHDKMIPDIKIVKEITVVENVTADYDKLLDLYQDYITYNELLKRYEDTPDVLPNFIRGIKLGKENVTNEYNSEAKGKTVAQLKEYGLPYRIMK